MSDEKLKKQIFLQSPLQVVNIGLAGFAHDLEDHGTPVVHVEWSPPARGDARLADLLSKLGG